MGTTRDLFKKIRDTKGTFHAKIDSIKDRNGMDHQSWVFIGKTDAEAETPIFWPPNAKN